MPESRRIAIMLDLEWPYKRHAEVFAGTQQYIDEQGWQSTIDQYAHNTLALHKTRAGLYDGIIARATPALLAQSRRLKIPVVNVWRSSPVQSKLPGVFPDYTAVGRDCAEHLLTRGFSNFATVTPQLGMAHQISRRAFERTVREAGFTCTHEFCLQNPTYTLANWRTTERLFRQLIATWKTPIGVFAPYEAIGRLIAQACQEHGLRVPNDVAIVTGQNEVTLCEHPRPSLTSMEYGYHRVGYEAAALLHRIMDGKPVPNKTILLPPIGIVVRESTDFYAVDNDMVAAALAFIAANSHRQIGQDDVAKGIGAETRTLQNRFRKHLGRPIVAEIRRVRLERAKRELAQTNLSIKEIAQRAGFGDSMRMYEVFRRELGITPTEFRDQLKQAEHAIPG